MQAQRFALAFALALMGCSARARVQLPTTELARASDGRVAFIRPTPDHMVSTSLGDAQATELWIADADGSHARRLVSGAAADSVERAVAAMSSPQFSLDGRRIYFLSRAWVTSDAVHVVDVATGEEHFVAPGNSLAIIPRGALAGCLLVGQHRYRKDADGSYDWTWLLGSDGHEIAPAATDSAGAEQRLAMWMSGSIPAGALPGSNGAATRCN